MGYCDSESCCTHDITRGITRDGVLHSICLECGSEFDADDMPVVDTATVGNSNGNVPGLGTPCGEDVAHKWGGIL